MPSFRSSVMAVAMAFVAVARADYYIDPESVELSKRQQWCEDEKRTCPIICQQMQPRTTLVNDCDPEKLTYGCLCGNNKRPNVTEYSLTLPYFVCQEWGNQCVEKCNGDNACASSCREDNPCGATDPKKTKVKPTPSGKEEPEASETQDESGEIFTGAPGSDSDDDGPAKVGDKGGAGAVLEVGSAYGLAVVLGGFFAGFALL